MEEEKERKMRTHKCGRKTSRSKGRCEDSFHDHGICALTRSNDRQHFDVYLVLQHTFHVLKHIDRRLHHAHETAATHTRMHRRHRSNFQLCVVHSLVNSQCVPTSFHQNFIAQKKVPKSRSLSRSVMSLEQQSYRSGSASAVVCA